MRARFYFRQFQLTWRQYSTASAIKSVFYQVKTIVMCLSSRRTCRGIISGRISGCLSLRDRWNRQKRQVEKSMSVGRAKFKMAAFVPSSYLGTVFLEPNNTTQIFFLDFYPLCVFTSTAVRHLRFCCFRNELRDISRGYRL